ncbi:MAG: hypothetical protein E7368_00855 [Clostridiales bacterium]|nr:hypothetical protein [Clostridiales bacterium]
MHPLFGTKHLILVGISLALIVVLTIFSRKLKFSTVCKTLLVVGVCSEIIKIFYYIVQNEATHGGVLPKTDLPFHLCSIQIIFIVIVNIAKSEKLRRFILSFMLPSCLFGGISALLIATDSSRNGMWIITAQYFLYHVAITVFSLHMFISKEIKFKAKDYVNCLKFLLILMFFAIYINSVVDDGSGKINFMYVVSPPQSGLPFLTEKYGWLVYIIHYACLILFCVTLCYIKPIIDFFKEKRANKALTKGTAQTNTENASIQEAEVAVSIDDSDK